MVGSGDGGAAPAAPGGRGDGGPTPSAVDAAEVAAGVVDVGALVTALRASGTTVACAESLTAGLVCAALADVPGASAVLRGAVVAYATDVKSGVLGVGADLLARRGPVDEDVALAMAAGAARLLGADLGVATTGVAGPGPADGLAAGTVVVAVAGGAPGPVDPAAAVRPGDPVLPGGPGGSGGSGPSGGAAVRGGGALVVRLHLQGDRAAVRSASARAALALLARWVAPPGGGPAGAARAERGR